MHELQHAKSRFASSQADNKKEVTGIVNVWYVVKLDSYQFNYILDISVRLL